MCLTGMDLYVTKNRWDFEIVYAKSAAHAHQIRALEAGETVESADASFDLSAWQVIDADRIEAKGDSFSILEWTRTEYGETQEGWDYYDWCEHGDSRASEEGRDGVSIASCMGADLNGIVIPAKE